MAATSTLRNALLSTCGFVCLLLVGAGCGDSAECVVDTDCELGNRCEAQVCVPLSPLPDRDTGPALDASEDTNSSVDAATEDSGPGDAAVDAIADVGPEDTGTDTGPVFDCSFDGAYTPTGVAGNPAGCPRLSQCVVVTDDAMMTSVDCESITGNCTYDADCVCSGTTGAVMIVADVPNSTLTATASGSTCNYTLVAL